jgi:hypothetical protein
MDGGELPVSSTAQVCIHDDHSSRFGIFSGEVMLKVRQSPLKVERLQSLCIYRITMTPNPESI